MYALQFASARTRAREVAITKKKDGIEDGAAVTSCLGPLLLRDRILVRWMDLRYYR